MIPKNIEIAGILFSDTDSHPSLIRVPRSRCYRDHTPKSSAILVTFQELVKPLEGIIAGTHNRDRHRHEFLVSSRHVSKNAASPSHRRYSALRMVSNALPRCCNTGSLSNKLAAWGAYSGLRVELRNDSHMSIPSLPTVSSCSSIHPATGRTHPYSLLSSRPPDQMDRRHSRSLTAEAVAVPAMSVCVHPPSCPISGSIPLHTAFTPSLHEDATFGPSFTLSPRRRA